MGLQSAVRSRRVWIQAIRVGLCADGGARLSDGVRISLGCVERVGTSWEMVGTKSVALTLQLVEPCIIYSHGMIIRPLPIVSSVISSHTHVGVEVLSTHGNIYEIAHAHCDGKIFTSILAELCRAKRACGAP